LDDKELKKLKFILTQKLRKFPDKRYGQTDKNSPVFQNFSLSTKCGQKVYQSFTDEELLHLLRETARELNHAPSQKEVFWVIQAYVKRRFEKWPYALKAAGLSSSAGKGGKSMKRMEAERREREKLLKAVRTKAMELGRLPHPADMGDLCEELNKYYSDWFSVIEAAGISSYELNSDAVYKIDDLEPEYTAILEAIREHSYEIGRSPIRGEIDINIKKALIRRCGSWRNALYQVGLEPVSKVRPFRGAYIDYRKDENSKTHTDNLQGCLYRVLNLTEEDKKRLAVVRSVYKQKGKVPMKKEVPKELRSSLQNSCGSWMNVLYQIGIAPEDYYRAYKEAKKNEK